LTGVLPVITLADIGETAGGSNRPHSHDFAVINVLVARDAVNVWHKLRFCTRILCLQVVLAI